VSNICDQRSNLALLIVMPVGVYSTDVN